MFYRVTGRSSRTCRYRIDLCQWVSTSSKTTDASAIPGSEMQDVQESGKCVTSDFSNLGLLHQRLVEQVGGIGLLNVLSARGVFAVLCLLLLRRSTGYVEAHLDKLVAGACRLLASEPCASQISICASVAIGGQGEVDGDFVLACQVRVGHFGVGDFEGGAVGYVEGEFSLPKVGLSPVPATQRMLPVVQPDAVPSLEDFGDAVEILLLEAIELYHAVVARENLDFVSA